DHVGACRTEDADVAFAVQADLGEHAVRLRRTRPVVDVAGVRALFIAWPDREIADVLGVRGGDVQVRGAGVGRDAAAAGDPHLVLAAGGDLAITLELAV